MVTLEEAKTHLRVILDFDDVEITAMIQAASAAVLDYLNRVGFDGPIPAPVKAAVLLQVGDLYECRERQSDRQMYRNPTYERLLNPYRNFAV